LAVLNTEESEMFCIEHTRRNLVPRRATILQTPLSAEIRDHASE